MSNKWFFEQPVKSAAANIDEQILFRSGPLEDMWSQTELIWWLNVS